jgi:hypothetical protein
MEAELMKAAIALEFGNQKHRDEFLKEFRGLLVKWGQKAPKAKIRCVTETESEFGMPDLIDLADLGVAKEPAKVTPIEEALREGLQQAAEEVNAGALDRGGTTVRAEFRRGG